MQEIILEKCDCPIEITLKIDVYNLVPGTRYDYRILLLNNGSISFKPDSGVILAENNTESVHTFALISQAPNNYFLIAVEVTDPFRNVVSREVICLKKCPESPQCTPTQTPTTTPTPTNTDQSFNPINYRFIGDLGNQPDPDTGKGQVSYYYGMSDKEITVGQWTEFLNSVAFYDDPYSLWKSEMNDNKDIGIQQKYDGLYYCYSIQNCSSIDCFAPEYNRPMRYLTWFDVARYCNWLHNNKKSGYPDASTTEDGAYALYGTTNSIISRNPGAKFWIPSDDEWYKAAYYNPATGKYSIYGNRSDILPGLPNINNQIKYFIDIGFDIPEGLDFNSPQNQLLVNIVLEIINNTASNNTIKDNLGISNFTQSDITYSLSNQVVLRYFYHEGTKYFVLLWDANLATLIEVSQNNIDVNWARSKSTDGVGGPQSMLGVDEKSNSWYGVKDTVGNIREWTDTTVNTVVDGTVQVRNILRQGSYSDTVLDYKNLSKNTTINSLATSYSKNIGGRIAINSSVLSSSPSIYKTYMVGGQFHLKNPLTNDIIRLWPGYKKGRKKSEPTLVSTSSRLWYEYSYINDINEAKKEYPGYELSYASLELVMLDSKNRVVAYRTTANRDMVDGFKLIPHVISCGFSLSIEYGHLPDLRGDLTVFGDYNGDGKLTLTDINLFNAGQGGYPNGNSGPHNWVVSLKAQDAMAIGISLPNSFFAETANPSTDFLSSVLSLDYNSSEKSVFNGLYAYKTIPESIIVTPTPSPTNTKTPTTTPTLTQTKTPTLSPTKTVTKTPTNTRTATKTPRPTTSVTRTSTATPTSTVTKTPTNTPSQTNTLTPTRTPTPTQTPTVSSSPTVTPSNTITNTPTQSVTPTPEATPTTTPTPSPTLTKTPTVTPSVSSFSSNIYVWGDNSISQLSFNKGQITEGLIDPARLNEQSRTVLSNFDNIVGYTKSGYASGVQFQNIQAGLSMSGGIDIFGNIHTVGNNDWGQLGIGNFLTKTQFVQINTPSNVSFSDLSLGHSHAVALDTTGSIWTWGRNSDGQLGNHYLHRPVNSVSLVDADQYLYDITIYGNCVNEFAINDTVNINYYDGTQLINSTAIIWTEPVTNNNTTTIRVLWESYTTINYSVIPTIYSFTKETSEIGLLANPAPAKINVYKEHRYCIDKELAFYSTPTPTATQTQTPTNTPTLTNTVTNTTTPEPTPTQTSSVTPTKTATPSITPSNTTTINLTPTATATPTNTPSVTATQMPTSTPTNTRTPTPSITASNTPSLSVTSSNTPTRTVTSTPTNTPTVTPTKEVFTVLNVYADLRDIITNDNKHKCLVNILGQDSYPPLFYKVKVLDVQWIPSINTTRIRIDHELINSNDEFNVPLKNKMQYISIIKFTSDDPDETSPSNEYEYETFSKVYASESHSYAMDTQGRIYSCGSNKYGQLGLGLVQKVNSKRDIVIENGSPVTFISIVPRLTMINPPSGRLYCYNRAFRWKKISLGRFHVVALDNNHNVWLWGDNGFGQIGIAESAEAIYKMKVLGSAYPPVGTSANRDAPTRNNTVIPYAPYPVKVFVIRDNTSLANAYEDDIWLDIAAGAYHNLAIKQEFLNNYDYGSLWGWGDNTFSQISRVTTSPDIIDNQPNTIGLSQIDFGTIDSGIGRNYWTRVFASRITSFAIKSVDGRMYSWGESNRGQTGNITNRTNLINTEVTIPLPLFNPNWNVNDDNSRGNITIDVTDIGNTGFIGINHLANHMLVIPDKFPTPTPTPSVTPSLTPTTTNTPTNTFTVTSTTSVTPTVTATVSTTPTQTPTITNTPSPTEPF